MNKDVDEFFAENAGLPQHITVNLLSTSTNSKGKDVPLAQPHSESNVDILLNKPEPISLSSKASNLASFSKSDNIKDQIPHLFCDENIKLMCENESDVCHSCNGKSNEENSIADDIAEWAKKFQISMVALSALLFILRLYNLNVPKDPRTLLKTPLTYEIQQAAGGNYFYCGIEKGIVSALKHFGKHFLSNNSCLNLQINIDGLPLFKSSQLQLWPILGLVQELRQVGPFVIALFSGNHKPSSLQGYLEQFVEELKSIEKNGIKYFDKTYSLKLDAFICDAPARSFLKGIKGHSGYHSCERCVQQGEWHNRLVFTEMNARLRTDESFVQMSDNDHHHKVSPLAQLNFGLVSGFVLDYMHLVCLGVVRKTVFLWLIGPVKTRLQNSLINQISSRLFSLKSHMPREFARKPRSLSEAKMWKATEYRQFLLYTGPVVLLGKLKPASYRNFLLLSVSIRLLLSQNIYSFSHDYIRKLLHTFVQNFSNIYGKFVLSYNVHNLLHIVDDYAQFGPLDQVSCFPFENFLGNLKKMVRKPTNPLAQILRRVKEKNTCSNKTIMKDSNSLGNKKQHFGGPLPSGYEIFDQFKQYCSSNLFLSSLPGDNCICINGSICVIKNIISSRDSTFLVYSKFSIKQSFSTYPFDLKLIDIYKVGELEDSLCVAELKSIQYKCVLLPHQTEFDYFLSMPLLHVQN